jgi:hypothetical protein
MLQAPWSRRAEVEILEYVRDARASCEDGIHSGCIAIKYQVFDSILKEFWWFGRDYPEYDIRCKDGETGDLAWSPPAAHGDNTIKKRLCPEKNRSRFWYVELVSHTTL